MKINDEEFSKQKKELEQLKTSSEKRGWIRTQLARSAGGTGNDASVLMRYEDFLIAQFGLLDQGEITLEKKQQQGKLSWNGQNNILIDIFYQLKRINNSKKEPLLPNSNEDIALFLKNNFECFNDTKLSTISGVLKKSERPLKSEKRILIECK